MAILSSCSRRRGSIIATAMLVVALGFEADVGRHRHRVSAPSAEARLNSASRAPDAATELLQLLKQPAAIRVMTSQGMEPVD